MVWSILNFEICPSARGDYIVFGDISAVPETDVPAIVAKESPLEITAPTEPIRLAIHDSRMVTLQLKNCSSDTQDPRIRIRLPGGVNVESSNAAVAEEAEGWNSYTWDLPPVAPKQTADISMRLTTDGNAKRGLHPASVQVTCTPLERWTLPVALPITIGTVLVEDNSFPTFGEYVIYAPRYILRMSKRYGTSRFLRDDSNRPRYEATFWERRPTAATTPDALPRLSVEGQDFLAWGVPAGFLWPNTAPASVTVGAGRSRITWTFEDDAIRIEPVALWSVEAPHEFIFPGGRSAWVAWDDKPEWIHIIALDEAGEIQVLSEPPPDKRKILAAALLVSGYDEVICFAVDRPQMAHFDGAGIRISVNPGEPVWFGLSQPDAFENWWQSRATPGETVK